MPKKFYAVRKGKTTGIFDSWEKCKKQVVGFSGAEYKSFLTMGEAESYINGVKAAPVPSGVNESGVDIYGEDTAVAYVDGSYKADTCEFSCGAVLFYKGKETTFSQKFNDPDMADMRNVAGEIMGSVSVMKYCIENGIQKLVIYHDYEGVAKWATGGWKANKTGTRAYVDFCRGAASHLDFSFVKVKGHSGDKFNDMADKLAKEALGIS